MNYFDVKIWSYARQPKVRLEENQLIIRTSFFIQIYCLFSYCRVVCADKAGQTLTIRTRYMWFFNKIQTIPFSRIRTIGYSYKYFPLRFDFWRGVDERFERFIVSVELVSPPETVKLFSFSGYEDDGLILYSKGCQDGTSRSYIDLLKEATGKKVGFSV